MAPMTRPYRFIGFLLFLAVAAHADDTATARVRFQEGVELYDKGQYEKARAAFLQAWALKQHPAILLNLAQSSLRSNRPAEAARWFQQLLRDSQGITPAQKIEAEKGLAEARTKDGRLDVQTAAGAEVFVDNERIGVAPLEPIDVEAGAHTVRVKGEPEQKVTVSVGQILAVKIGSVATPTTTAPTPTASTTATAPPTKIDESFLGGAGESCRSRADCKSSLKCMKHTCLDENAPPPPDTTPETTPEPAQSDWLAFRLEGGHGFVGVTALGGPSSATLSFGGPSFTDRNAQGSFLFALRGGVFLGHHEIALEISPFTYLPYSTSSAVFAGAAFQMMGTYGYFIPLHEGSVSVYWPLRTGIGIFAGGDNTSGLAYFQVRADLVGVALRVGHLVIDLSLPSFRYGGTSGNRTTVHLASWHFGGSVSYVF